MYLKMWRLSSLLGPYIYEKTDFYVEDLGWIPEGFFVLALEFLSGSAPLHQLLLA